MKKKKKKKKNVYNIQVEVGVHKPKKCSKHVQQIEGDVCY